MKAGKRLLTPLPGLSTHARGRGVSGNVPTPLLSTFPRSQCPPARVHAKELGRRTCACVTSDGRTVNSGVNMSEHIFRTKIRNPLDFCPANKMNRINKKKAWKNT